MTTVLVIGAGVCGPVLAIHLKNNGYNPIVFEKIKEVKDVGGSLHISPNGFKALSKVGLDKKMLDIAPPIEAMVHFKSDGTELSSEDYGYFTERYGFHATSIPRYEILKILLAGLQEHGIPVHFGKHLVSIEDDPTTEYVRAIFKDGTQYQGAFLVGCDGMRSATRAFLFGQEAPQYTGLTAVTGHSPRPEGLRNVVYTIYGINSFFISFPVSRTHAIWNFALRQEQCPDTWENMEDKDAEEIKQNTPLASWAEPVPTLIKTSERMIRGGLYDRPPLAKWHKGRCVLIGDAAHPTSPHLAQGANQALVDCMVLVKYILASPSNLEQAFVAFANERSPRTAQFVAAARALGERRVMEGEEACAQRDEYFRHLYDDVQKNIERRDNIFCEDY